ncbi:helicase sen1 protein [Rutstroemia sp. NJR-2017a WRK4]|nr:helicase sen1 protein [Rutstroemia sp. NJR-2017a WRK4]
MRDEADIMDELQELHRELKAFPQDAHWFCPKRNDEDYADYSRADEKEDDLSPETKKELIQDAKKRHAVAYKYSLVTGLAADVGGAMIEEYTGGLNKLLRSCDKCVHNWHLGRKAYLKELAEQFDEDMVAELSNRLLAIDFQRIDSGLKASQKVIEEAEPQMRTQKLLAGYDSALLLSLYESLCCIEYHKSEKNLSKHFNFVFEEIQSKKVLRISDILPATGRFLFDSNPIRLRFARCAWQKTTGMLTPELFDWVVHDTLSEAVTFVAQNNHDHDAIIRFWESFTLILERLDDRLITYSLRAMEVQPSVYLLALQHLTCKSEAIVQLVIEALRKLLKTSPKSFWAAFNTVSPATVAEQIFMSPTYGNLLGRLHEYGAADTSFILGWIPEFINSLPADHQFDVCGSFLYNLLERLQNDKFPEHTRLACCCAGLDALRATLETFVDSNYNINPSTSLIIINNVMALVDTYKGMILGSIELREQGHNQVEMRRLSMLVIRDALALDCKALSAEFQALAKSIPIQQGLRGHSQPIWQAVLDIFRPGNVDLAKTILSATSHLTGLDELRPKDKKQATLPTSHTQYNKDFRQLTENVSRIFERLSDFDASDLVQMYQDSQTSRPLFAALVSADQQIYEAAVEVVKASTGQISKRDAISSLLELTFVPMMHSVTYAITRIAKARNFSPMPYMIKIGRDMVYALCDTTGYLRSHTSLNTIERNAVMTWWITQWRALDVMFSTTEEWGMRVQRSKEDMQDFCRDGMEYAESLFNQYRIIASAVGATSDSGDDQVSARISSKDAIQKVLQVVCQNVNGLTMMLRLRDTYLVGVITSLLATLLKSLAEFDTEVDQFALEYIQDACKDEDEKGFRRTNLSKQQKADLRAALDEHKGFEIMQTISFAAPKKQATIDSWSKSAGGVKHEPTFNFKERQSSLDAWSKSGDGKKYEPGSSTQSSRTSSFGDPFPKLSEKQKLLMEQVKAKQAKTQEASESLMARRRKDAEEKKQRDAAAIAQARALRAPTALVKGEGSGLKGISATGPVKKTKRQHSKKDLRARVEPNMDIIYLEILNWDIFHQGDEPPTNNVCKKIADSFLDLNLYKETFKPLLISEVWRSLVTAKEENNYKPIETKVLNRLSVDKFMEVSTSIPLSTSRDNIVFERDIVLLSKSPNPLLDERAPHCLAQVSRRTRKKDVMEVTYKVSRDVGATLLQCFVPNGMIYALKIADMTTTLREFAALSSLEYYDLCTEILEAKPSPLQKYSDEKVTSISTRYKLNKGQAKAILSANDNDGFTLIQGPPGSGKTKTIIAMVGSLLTQALQQQAQQTGVRLQGQKGAAAAQLPKKKLLICAPSNAAVDELVLRLMEGILPLNGSHQKIKVVRLGRSDAINASVKDVTLDELVRIKLEGDMESKKGQLTDREMLHKEAGAIKERLNVLRAEMESCRLNNDKTSELKLQREFDELKRKQAHIGNKIDEDKNSDTKARASDLTRRQFTKEIIDEAHVLCSTLSGSGHETLLKLDNVEFETVIIDEAAQCIELSAIIPLKYGATKCILVGDPEQLPPTVLSRQAKSFGYEQSLFVRMQHNHPNDVHLLDTQYRMHPEISRFPSQQFYNSRLLDGDGMARLRAQPWHASAILGPYRFFDVEGIQSKEAKGHSFINVPELNAALRLYERLKTDYRSYDFKGKIGIITTYKAQLNELKNRFQRRYGEGIFEEIEFNTTDAFQGREREIIIFSCVRAQATGGIGFLNDIRRMNVGLTRAKSSLWVLGDSRALEQGQFWSRLIHDARSRNRYTSGDIMGLLSRPTSNDAPPPDFSNPAPVLSNPPFADNVDVDVEMPDAPARSVQGSSSSSTPAASVDQITTPTDSNAGDKRKRQRDRGSVDESLPTKKKKTATNSSKSQTPDVDVAPPSNLRTEPAEKKVDLAAALEAQQASKAAAAAARPNLPPPPRRKAPTDPFIQRKPPKRR